MRDEWELACDEDERLSCHKSCVLKYIAHFPVGDTITNGNLFYN